MWLASPTQPELLSLEGRKPSNSGRLRQIKVDGDMASEEPNMAQEGVDMASEEPDMAQEEPFILKIGLVVKTFYINNFQ